MEKYSSYKDSGVKWLGEIPSHWELKHLRNFLTLFSEKGYGNAPLLSVTREKGVILRNKDDKEENHNFVPDDLSGYKHLYPGDFVINKMKSWQGSYGVSEYEGIVSPAYFTCKLRGVDPQFFSRAIRSKAYIGFFMQYSKGIRVDQWDLDPSSMKDIPFILPPLDEQKRIVPYLDAATAKIDEAIFHQQRVIDLLNERKQILIDRAVSRGAPSDHAPMLKDSGYDWLGQIPAHWDINKLKYLCKMFGRIGFRGYSAEDLVEEGEGAVTLSPTNIIEGKLDFTECSYLSWQKYYESPEIMVFPGDVIFVKTASIGKTAYVESIPIETTVNPQILVLKEIIPNSEYLSFYLQSSFMQGWVKATANGSTILTIPQTTIGNYPIALPSPDEQVAIVDYLKVEIGKIERAKASVNSTINLLQERKQIIIKDMVTGKVRVV